MASKQTHPMPSHPIPSHLPYAFGNFFFYFSLLFLWYQSSKASLQNFFPPAISSTFYSQVWPSVCGCLQTGSAQPSPYWAGFFCAFGWWLDIGLCFGLLVKYAGLVHCMLKKRRNIFGVTKDTYISKWVDLGLICSSMSFDPLHPITKWAGLERLCPGRPNLSSVFISFAHGFGNILGYKPVIYIEFVKSVRPTSMYAYQKGRTALRSCYLGPLPCVCVRRWFHVCLSASSVLILGIASHLALGLWGSSLP